MYIIWLGKNLYCLYIYITCTYPKLLHMFIICTVAYVLLIITVRNDRSYVYLGQYAICIRYLCVFYNKNYLCHFYRQRLYFLYENNFNYFTFFKIVIMKLFFIAE